MNKSTLEVEFYEKPINRCTNRCVFCFIEQIPRGLRSSLYIKDEDFKHSFLNGDYVTLSSATQQDLERIDLEIRRKMLHNKRTPDIKEQLRFLKDNGICFHTQIVVCPGYNDAEVLDQTIRDLLSYESSLLSIALVPVGLTRTH